MLIILDRDGVINHDSDAYIKSEVEWHAIPRALEAIARLNQAGCTVVVATNQSGIGRGLYTTETLEKIHAKMQRELAAVNGHLDGIYFCPHHPRERCECRKPNPGLLLQIKRDYTALFHQAMFVGDSARDIIAANRAQCHGVLVKTGNGEKALKEHDFLRAIPVFSDLYEFSEYFVKSKTHTF